METNKYGYSELIPVEIAGMQENMYFRRVGERIEFYDEEWNRFHKNYRSIEKAEAAIVRLAKKGIIAVVGQRAPWVCNNIPIHNDHTNEVGVYIIQDAPRKRVRARKKKTDIGIQVENNML